jgi:hypothetical protein
LWRDVGTLAYYNVALGYGDGTYRPTEPVLYAQMISFITRAMVRKGFWQQQLDNSNIYPNVPGSSGHRADITTYAYYVGPLPDTDVQTQDFPTWNQPAPRGWCARALWQGIRNDLFRMPPFTFASDPVRRFYNPAPNVFTSRFINPDTQLVNCDAYTP